MVDLFKKGGTNKVLSQTVTDVNNINNKMPKKNFKCRPAFLVNVQLFLVAEKLANLD